MNELTIKHLEGEIFTPKDTVRVIGRPRPLLQEHINIELPAGHTVSELIDIACGNRKSNMPVAYAAYVDGVLVPSAMQDRVRLKPGRVLTFEPRLAGGSAGRSIALIAVAVLALVVATVLLGPTGSLMVTSAFWASAAGAGVVIAGSMAVNALFPIAPQKTPLSALAAGQETIYGISGASNQADPFGPIPSILGRVRVYPRYASMPFTTFEGTDQFLRLLFVIGYGPLNLSELKIGETELADFDDITWEEREGYASDVAPTLYNNQAFEEALNIDMSDHDGTWFVRTTENDVNEISGDFSMPVGWFKVNEAGETKGINVDIDVEYREAGTADPWVQIYTLNEQDYKKKNPRRFGFKATVTRGPAYEVRARSTSSTPDEDKFQVNNQLQWITLRAFRGSKPIVFSKPLSLVAIKIRATGQLNGIIDSFNCVAESRVNSFTGVTWDTGSPPTWDASRNPADLIRHVLQGPAIYQAVSDEQLDLTSLEQFWQYCADEGWEYNREHGFRGSVFDTLQTIASAGRGRIVRTDGKWGVIWDEADVAVAQHFSHRNSWGFEEMRVYVRPPHAFRCPFVNQQKGWAADERIVYADGYTSANATIFESVEFPGVTDPGLIWRLARFQMAQVLLRPSTYTLTTNWQALSCTVGSRIYANHDATEWGLASARVVAVAGDVVVLDEEVVLEAGVEYVLRFRQPTGASVVRAVTVPAIGATKTITLVASALPDPVVGDLVMFGNDVGGEAVLLRVRDIEWLPDLTARLSLVDDAPGIADADAGAIPAYDSQVTAPSNLFLRQPYNLEVMGQTYLLGTVAKIRAMISWSALAAEVEFFEVQIRHDDLAVPTWDPLITTAADVLSAEADDLDPGVYSFRVRSIFGPKSWSAWTEHTLLQLDSEIVPPADVTNFKLTSLGDVVLLSWDAVPAPNISHYIIRQTSATVGVTWGLASILFPQVNGTSIPAPPLTGTYLIKAVTFNALESANPTLIISQAVNLRDLNIVETLSPSTESPPWPGTLDNLTLDGTELVLSGAGSPMDGSYTYDAIVDLGDVYTSRLTADVIAYGDNTGNFMASWITLAEVITLSGALNSDWTFRLEERHTSDDPGGSPVTWSDWTELTITDITARAFDFRFFVATLNPDVDVRIAQADISVDMPDRIEGIGDFSVSNTGTVTVTFSVPFKFLETVLVTAIQGANSGDYADITNKTTAGFDIAVYDSADVRVTRTVDILAVGYGKAVA